MEKEYPIHYILGVDHYLGGRILVLYEKENNSLGRKIIESEELTSPDIVQFTDEKSKIVITTNSRGRELFFKLYLQRNYLEKN